jgi:hypothetical protein
MSSVGAALANSGPSGGAVATVGTRTIELHYSVEVNGQPLRSVELWYTFDRGETWRLYGRDADMVPPMTFHAPQSGLCGVYFVMTNHAGASGPQPSAETEAHLWVLVDETPPIVQFHRPQIVAHGGSRMTARLRWAAMAEGLPERPVDLAYRVLPEGPWREVAIEIPNSGAYDWDVPAEVRGEVMFRASVRDRAGRRSEAASETVTITEAPPVTDAVAAPRSSSRVLSAEEMKRARELLRQGRRHQLHGAHDLAAARLRDALKVDPELSEALVGLGSSLYALGAFMASAQSYELALRYTPEDRDALEGLAQTLVALKKYEAAEARLLAIVQRQPQDTEIWLHLGDLAIYQGNEVTARDYYLKAATLAPDAVSVVSRARARLDDLPTLQSRYQQLETP